MKSTTQRFLSRGLLVVSLAAVATFTTGCEGFSLRWDKNRAAAFTRTYTETRSFDAYGEAHTGQSTQNGYYPYYPSYYSAQ